MRQWNRMAPVKGHVGLPFFQSWQKVLATPVVTGGPPDRAAAKASSGSITSTPSPEEVILPANLMCAHFAVVQPLEDDRNAVGWSPILQGPRRSCARRVYILDHMRNLGQASSQLSYNLAVAA